MGFLSSGKKAARIQAKATTDSANMQAASDRVVAQGAQQSLETQLAQKLASDKAAETLSKPQGQIDVQLAPDANVAEVDPVTRRRKTTRSRFFRNNSPSSGISI
jgi:hypothetical protein